MPKSKGYKICAICEHTSPYCTCKSFTVGSVFSGLGGFDLGLERAGMKVVWQIEIDPFRRRILERHWPDVERFEDVRTVNGRPASTGQDISTTRGNKYDGGGIWDAQRSLGSKNINLLCGGFPCQDLSVAGRRGGIHAERSGLFFEFARLAGELRPEWLLIENVPGLLSSNKGEDFETVLQTLSELGYAVAWRVLDSRYFGVPQRRRRVYIVGHTRADCAAAVLFEPEGGAGDSEKGGEKGEGVAYALTGSPRGTGDGHGNAWNTTYVPEVSHALTRRDYKSARPEAGGAEVVVTPTYIPETTGVLGNASGKRGWKISAEDAADGKLIVCAPTYPDRMREATGVPRRLDSRPRTAGTVTGAEGHNGNSNPIPDNYIAAPLEASDGHHGHSSPRGDGADNLVTGVPSALREDGLGGAEGDTERPPRAPKPCCPDGPRYAALGDAVTTSVVQWLGERMMIVEEGLHSLSG